MALPIGSVLTAAPAFALGTHAGTIIASQARAEYIAGGASVSIAASNVNPVTVDEVLDADVKLLGAGSVPIASDGALLSYRLVNSGNGDEAFHLTAEAAPEGGGFDPGISWIALDANDNGVFDEAFDLPIAQGGLTPVLAPDAGMVVFVHATLPPSTADGERSAVRLSAVPATLSGDSGTFARGVGDDGTDVVIGRSATNLGVSGPLVARASRVVLAKSASVVDRLGGSTPTRGALVTYAILAKVGKSGPVADLTVEDAIPAGTSYRPGSLTLDGSTLSDAMDGDAGYASGRMVSVDLDDLPAGSVHAISFSVTID